MPLTSGRVIALGRAVLAAMFLLVAWIDAWEFSRSPVAPFALLIGYVWFALGIIVATWRNWWLDAHLAGPAHTVDIAMFTALVYLTEGDKSPFFPFFIFVLLASAIRWGWRATALSAVLLTLLYLVAGQLAANNEGFELDRFIARTGYLVILSLLLIWFGVNQWRVRLPGAGERPLFKPSIEALPLDTGLKAAMAGARASAGAFVWAKAHKSAATAIVMQDGEITTSSMEAGTIPTPARSPFLYDVAKRRALMRDPQRSLRAFDPAEYIQDRAAIALGLSEGLAIPVMGEGAEGQIYLEQVRGLSTDHLELGEEIGAAVEAHLRRQALMKVAGESAEARSRLAVARDLHDSVVQFLAGAAFRLEAMKRSKTSGRDVTPELDELKGLMLQEQSELREFITALRSGSQMELAELAKDLQSLANRLSRQWDVQCTFSVDPSELIIPARMHLDAQQLVREAVANAVRHAGAKNVSIRLGGEADEVRLDFINDGKDFPKTGKGDRMPRSLKERVEAAGGILELSRGMGVTKISILLPVVGKAA